MKNLCLLSLFLMLISCNKNDISTIIDSPDKKIKVIFFLDNGTPYYSIEKEDKLILKKSKLGLILKDNVFLNKNFIINNIQKDSYKNLWKPLLGEYKIIENNYNELKIELKQNKKILFLEFRIFNDGIGFRYNVPNQKNIKNYDIIDEITEFNLSEKDSAFWQPAFSYRRYEFLYANTRIDEISKKKYSELVEDLSFDSIGFDAAQTPLTIKKNNGLFISIHEANLINYSSMTLSPKGKGKLEALLYPWSDGTKVKLNESIISPWRTIQIADSSSDLLNSSLILNLNEDPEKTEDYSWVKPGKYMGVWWEMIGTNESTWWPSEFHGANTNKVKKYLDFASKHNFDGLLVEGWNKGWYPEWCCSGNGIPFNFIDTVDDFDFNEITSYISDKNISIVGHHETGGQIENYENQLEEAFKLYQKMGVKYVKTGYVNDVSKNIKRIEKDGNVFKEWHHGQFMINHFQKVIEIAAKYKISIITHEPIKDTGLRRKFPNFISREGAKGQEFNGFSSNGVNHATDLPFTRLLSGPMDYTPGIFQLNKFRFIAPGTNELDYNAIVPSTIAKELALYVAYYSPMQMAADLPKHYKKHPRAFEFIKKVPVNWESKLILNSKISEYLTIARKDINSENWYIGGITDEKQREFYLKLDFLNPKHEYLAKIYQDTKKTHWKKNPMEYEIKEIKINNESTIPIYLAPGGGFAIEIIKN
ncbi:MAG: glycoside hydrolase family 97 protein [Flavobacteriaceae bacterium]|nr:glycoside hydrolase family 97 protein [Flavobacteriaceae bacterium]